MNKKKILFSHKVSFILLGVSSLIGWNAVLSSLDFFSNKYPKNIFGDCNFLFAIPLQSANFLMGLLVPKLA